MMITVPPMVGVPRLAMCDCGPSSRISCPKPSRRNSRIASGVHRIETSSDTSAATRTDLTEAAPTGSASASATRSRPAARLAFTSTTSSGRSWARSSAMAASASSTCTAPSRAAAYNRCASGPTTTTRSTPSSAVSSPTRRCSSAADAPSSAISPSTAQDRRPRAIVVSARSAAAIDSGLAL